MLLPDGDEVEAIVSPHLSSMDFSGNCCCHTHAPTHVTGLSCKLSNIPSRRPTMVWQILVGTSGDVAFGTHTTAQQAARCCSSLRFRPRWTLLPDQLDFACGGRRMHGSVHGRRDPRLRSRVRSRVGISCTPRRAWRWRMRCWSLPMAAAIGLSLPGISLAADPPIPYC